MEIKTPNWLKYHVADSISLLTVTNPIYSAFEVGVAGMSDEVSIKARTAATVLSLFFGMGWAFGKGRNIWRKGFNITDRTKERVQMKHDILYSGAFNFVVAPIIYLASGVNDVKQLAIGTGTSVAFGMFQGPLMGYAVGVGRDLAGLEPCERKTYPDLIRRQNPKVKKGIAAGLAAASIGLMSLIYSATPNDNLNDAPQQNQTERVYDNNQLEQITQEAQH
jgi:hypothetical protein